MSDVSLTVSTRWQLMPKSGKAKNGGKGGGAGGGKSGGSLATAEPKEGSVVWARDGNIFISNSVHAKPEARFSCITEVSTHVEMQVAAPLQEGEANAQNHRGSGGCAKELSEHCAWAALQEQETEDIRLL